MTDPIADINWLDNNPWAWRYVLDVRDWYGTFWEFFKVVYKTSYPFFIWNGVVYSTTTGHPASIYQIELTV